MNIDLIVAIVEIIGAIGVIVTLIYLAVQVKENTKLQKIESRRFETESTDSFFAPIVENQEVALLFLNGLKNSEDLSAQDYLRFSLLFGKFMAANTMVWEEFVSGIASQDDLDRRNRTIKLFLDTPGGRQFWGLYRHNYPPGFQSFVDTQVLADG